MWNDNLPRDVLSEILTNPKLSIKDIVRCSFVCKSWCSLVTSPSFVSLHSTQQQSESIAKNKKGLFLVNQNNNFLSLNLDDDSLSDYKRLDFPLKEPFYYFKVVDCLNGVVCLWHEYNHKIVLWNPSIKRLLKLPNPPIPLRSFFVGFIGFGFDAATNDFKVIRVLTHWHERIGSKEHRAEVYELSAGRWRRIRQEVVDWRTPGRVSSEYQAFLNGVVHWVGREPNKCIVTFDFRNESFGRIDMPADFGIPRYRDNNLRVYVIWGELLSLIYHNAGEACVIWVMKEYGVSDSWIKFYTVSNSVSNFGILNSWEFLSTRLNSDLIMKKYNEIVPWSYSYVPDTKHVQRLEFFQSRDIIMVNFMESLALVGVKGGEHGLETNILLWLDEQGDEDLW